jgi:dihydrofolate reductase
MRDLVLTQNTTADGVVDLEDDWFSPGGGENRDDLLAELRRQDESADALLLGRQTFEDFRSYWPRQTEDRTGITAYLDGVAKYVVSSTLTEPGWENTTVLSGPVLEEVRALKEQPGRDIVTTGSVTLTRALVPSGLVDEYRLFVHPYVAGPGRRLFTETDTVGHLVLQRSQAFACGVVLMVYRPA